MILGYAVRRRVKEKPDSRNMVATMRLVRWTAAVSHLRGIQTPTRPFLENSDFALMQEDASLDPPITAEECRFVSRCCAKFVSRELEENPYYIRRLGDTSPGAVFSLYSVFRVGRLPDGVIGCRSSLVKGYLRAPTPRFLHAGIAHHACGKIGVARDPKSALLSAF
jgi:hypothetical protein